MMNPEEASLLSNKLNDLNTFLDAVDKEHSVLMDETNLPDFAKLQESPDTQRIGFLTEDIENALANIGIEISDARKSIDRLQNELKKVLTNK